MKLRLDREQGPDRRRCRAADAAATRTAIRCRPGRRAPTSTWCWTGPGRQYSLCGDPADTIGPAGRRPARAGRPRRLAPRARVLARRAADRRSAGRATTSRCVEAERYLFIAGGIGITPILPMIAEAAAAGARNGGWSTAAGAGRRWPFLDELSRRHPDDVGSGRRTSRACSTCSAMLGRAAADTAVYCCGPEPLLAAVERHRTGRPARCTWNGSRRARAPMVPARSSTSNSPGAAPSCGCRPTGRSSTSSNNQACRCCRRVGKERAARARRQCCRVCPTIVTAC